MMQHLKRKGMNSRGRPRPTKLSAERRRKIESKARTKVRGTAPNGP